MARRTPSESSWVEQLHVAKAETGRIVGYAYLGMTTPTPHNNQRRVIKQRTCLGCRAVAHSRELLRFVVVDGAVCVDDGGKRGGRGAWSHPTAECLKQALAKKAFQRAFRGTVDTSAVQAWIEMTTGRNAPRDESG